uniref:Geminin coiled-coil domain containing n=1 Tax=Neogobius melanostomus TaxID=47308 RepID=A0A8C6U1W4_9GOBI
MEEHLIFSVLISDSQYVESSAPTVSCAMWTELSPHLQRNKQLHDTLLQREEELARLQEENHKLRQFLNSSFVKDIEEKAKKLRANDYLSKSKIRSKSSNRKRNLSSSGAPISKRVCRNLTTEFCSESEPSEPSLDLWVLKTLGLKDKDTIDTTTGHNVSAADHYHSPVDAGSTSRNVYDSPQEVRDHSSPLQTTISYSPLKRLNFSCATPNTPGSPCGPGTPTGQPDLAFSMCLSSNHSVKTHSFPHGQAFVRRDTQGRCNFTWVPRDRP